MGRGRIRAAFKDRLGPGEPAPNKDAGFSASSIPNASPSVFRELKAGVSKVESRIGIDLPQGNLGFTDDGRGFIGIHFGEGTGRTVLFNRAFYNRNVKDILADFRYQYKVKFLTESNSPLQHVVVHELGHSIWVSSVEGKSSKLRELSNGINRLYDLHKRDVARGYLPISKYARKDIDEFFAETFTKAIIGKRQNKYSRDLLKLLRKYKVDLKNIR